MIPGEALAMTQVGLVSMAVLAAVAVAGKEECVGDLTAEAAGNVDEVDQPDDRRFGQREAFASDAVAPSASTISAFPSITSRRARRTGTMVSGSKEAFSARHALALSRYAMVRIGNQAYAPQWSAPES